MMAGFEDHPIVRTTFNEASTVLGEDLWALVTDGPEDALNKTVNTQPVMLTAGVAVWRAWQAAGGAAPTIMAGHSLGEYTALVAASALAFDDAVPLVRFRAQAMQEAVPAGVGAMAAILGLDATGVAAACTEAAQGQGGATSEDAKAAQPILEQGMRYGISLRTNQPYSTYFEITSSEVKGNLLVFKINSKANYSLIQFLASRDLPAFWI